MESFFVMPLPWNKGNDWFSFDPLVKANTYAFLHFVPDKESPKKVKIIASLKGKDNSVIETHDFLLEIDSTGKRYQEHYIGLVQDGMYQRLFFSTINAENNTPMKKVCIGVEVVKIMDGNDDDNDGGWLTSGGPKAPYLIDKKLYV